MDIEGRKIGPDSLQKCVGDSSFGGAQKGGFQKGGFGGCSPGTKAGTRVRSDVPPGTKTGTRVRSHVPPERKPERGYIRQNHPLRKPPFYLPVIVVVGICGGFSSRIFWALFPKKHAEKNRCKISCLNRDKIWQQRHQNPQKKEIRSANSQP